MFLLAPISVIMDSTSTADFTCVNHESNDKRLESGLSKPIASNLIKITEHVLNKTAINIQLEAKNYVGIFHLLCYTSGEKAKGTRADVIVKGKKRTAFSHTDTSQTNLYSYQISFSFFLFISICSIQIKLKNVFFSCTRCASACRAMSRL